MKYTVRTNRSGRYIQFCDDCWYDTTSFPLHKFTMEEAEKITEQMKHHYSYDLDIIDENDTVVKSVKWISGKVTPIKFNKAVEKTCTEEPKTEIKTSIPMPKKEISQEKKKQMLKMFKRFGPSK
jgi:DNA-directed RNA polymerase subunit H (RpoH/RPB5)